MADFQYEEEPKASKLPVVALAARVTTLIALGVSVGLLRSNSVTYDYGPIRVPFNFKNIQTYNYVFLGMVVGFCCTLLQLPSALYYSFRKKRLINNNAFLMFEFYVDKACMILLATAIGSLFGATVETKRGADRIGEFIRTDDGTTYDAKDYHSKIGDFCMMIYISSVFLLIGCFSSVISSIISSKALANKL